MKKSTLLLAFLLFILVRSESAESHQKEIKEVLLRVSRIRKLQSGLGRRLSVLVRRLENLKLNGGADQLIAYSKLKDDKSRQRFLKEEPSFKSIITSGLIVGIPAFVLSRVISIVGANKAVKESERMVHERSDQLVKEQQTTEAMFKELSNKLMELQASANGLGEKALREVGLFNEELRIKMGQPL